MIDLATDAQTGAVKLSTISERQNISLPYFEQLPSKLRRAGLVENPCGSGGDYILAMPAEQINIAQIISAAEDRLDAIQCGNRAGCHHSTPCLTHDLWESLSKTINDYLNGVTLQSTIEQKNCSDNSHVVTFIHIH